jgi:hypothetical protein
MASVPKMARGIHYCPNFFKFLSARLASLYYEEYVCVCVCVCVYIYIYIHIYLLIQSALQPLVGFRPAQLPLSILSRKVLQSVVTSGTSNPQLGGEPGI